MQQFYGGTPTGEITSQRVLFKFNPLGLLIDSKGTNSSYKKATSEIIDIVIRNHLLEPISKLHNQMFFSVSLKIYNNIMERIKAIENNFATYLDLHLITQKHESTVKWLWENGLLVSSVNCCGENMKVYTDKSKIDIYYFFCLKCKGKRSIRQGSFFWKYDKTPLMILARLIFVYFAEGTSAKTAKDRIREQAGYPITKKNCEGAVR
eukprot:TRINITY_DN12817_c0_g1_i1.p1 TRINITY_DN12817_c0_g1~~TRINITY_DN12817_c0_g1_i1.p1  ORF type:complete len:214 (+),score=6.87 TRINITY_DN12817_c0_g1_i1:23-643(+)